MQYKEYLCMFLVTWYVGASEPMQFGSASHACECACWHHQWFARVRASAWGGCTVLYSHCVARCMRAQLGQVFAGTSTSIRTTTFCPSLSIFLSAAPTPAHRSPKLPLPACMPLLPRKSCRSLCRLSQAHPSRPSSRAHSLRSRETRLHSPASSLAPASPFST